MKKRFVIPIVSVLCIGVILLVRWMGEKPATTAASDSSRILTAAERLHMAKVRAKQARAILAQSKPRPATTVTVGTAPKSAPAIYGTQWGREEEREMKAFSDWSARYAKTPSSEKSRLLEEGVRLAKERAEVLAELIEYDPEAALAMAIPQSTREGLPEEVLAHSERRIIGTGRLEVIASTAEPGRAAPAVQRSVQLGRRSYQAYVYGGLKRFGTVDDLYMHGIAVNGSLALADSPVRELEPGERLKPDKSIAANHATVKPQIYQPEADGKRLAEDAEGYLCLHCNAAARASYDAYHWAALGGDGTIAAAIGRAYNNNGSKSCLIIPVQFPDRLGSPWSSDAVRDSGIAAIKSFFSTSSYGLFNVNNSTVIPLQTLPSNRSTYRDSNGSYTSAILTAIRTDAATLALTAGYDVENYNFVSIVINHDLWTGGVAGVAQLGAKYNWIDGSNGGSEQDQEEFVYIHELGHNLGLRHAGAWDSSTAAPEGSGSRVEYGHPFDALGNNPQTYSYDQLHYNAAFKNAMDWLPDGFVESINTNTTTTLTLNLYAMDRTQVSGRKYAVKIPAGIMLGAGTNLDYWIEYRSRYPSVSSVNNGVLIYSANSTHDSDALNLLDMTPATSAFTDAGLPVGSSYTTATLSRITVNSQGGTGDDAYINVTISSLVMPSITTHPQDTSVQQGSSTSLTVTASGATSYQWRKDGVALSDGGNISGATTSTLSLTNAASDTAGTYTVVVTNANGSVTSNGAVITVVEPSGGGGGGCGYTTPPEQLLLIGWGVLLLCRFLQRMPIRPLQPREEAA